MNPATIALLLKAFLAGIPALIQEYNIAKEKGNYTQEERDALDALIAGYGTKPNWQE